MICKIPEQLKERDEGCKNLLIRKQKRRFQKKEAVERVS